VAYRGHIPLEDIEAGFEVDEAGVRKTIKLFGDFSESEEQRLRRTIEYCSVGKIFTRGSLEIEDRVEARGPAVLAAEPRPFPPTPAGAVTARYLRQTRECAADGRLEYEGEVDVHLSWQNLTRQSRCALLAGHTSEGWAPPPVPLAYAALAASTATALRQVLPAPAEFRVELARQPAAQGGTPQIEQAQADAVGGVVRITPLLRTVVLAGEAEEARIRAALRQEPLSRVIREGGLLIGERVGVGRPPNVRL
jgi:uncharacterized OsmC-like protein